MSASDQGFPIDAPGLNNRGLSLHYVGWLGDPVLYIDGKPAEKISRNREYRLVKNDGEETTAQVRSLLFGTKTAVTIDNKGYQMPSGLRWQHYLWAALPILLFTLDRILGALLGAIAMVLSLHVLRSEKPAWQRFLVTLGINAAAIALFILIETFVLRLLAAG